MNGVYDLQDVLSNDVGILFKIPVFTDIFDIDYILFSMVHGFRGGN